MSYSFSIPGADSPLPSPLSMNRIDANARRTMPTFFVEAVELPAQSAAEGRPVFRDVEYVRILIPGDSKTEVIHKVSDKIRMEYRAEYEHWKRTQQQAVVGTPLEQWPGASASFIKTCKHFNVFSVESLAEMSDGLLGNLGMGAREMRERARAWLASAKDNAVAEKLAAENSQLQAQIDSLTQQIAAMGARFSEIQAEAPRKGR